MIDYDDVVKRIQAFWSSSTDAEKQALRQILFEISDIGESPTYENIWLADYKEIPVDIDQFLDDNQYLGTANNGGNSIYPFWRQCMEDIFHAGNRYEENFFTGATRTGKSSTGVTCTSYMLYKLMCLRNPQRYFQKKENSKFSILFFNLTLKLARGVGFTEFSSLLKSSPWFDDHGRYSKESIQRYLPEGDKIEIDFGSDAADALGKQVFCLVGDTEVYTIQGIRKLSELVDQDIRVKQYCSDLQSCMYSRAHVTQTGEVISTIRVYLSEVDYFECTSDHLIMLSDGSYKKTSEITSDDYLMCPESNRVKIHHIEHVHHSMPIPVYDVVDAHPNHNFVVRTDKGDIVAHNCAFTDEVNFSRSGVKDTLKAKSHMSNLFTTVTDRVKGTFRMNGEVYGKVFAISSKKSDSDFMEEYIQQQHAAGYGYHMFVADKPQWEVQPSSNFSKERFYIAVGDRYHRGFVVEDDSDEALDELIAQGYTLIQPPIDYESQFRANFDIALRDIAGISVPGSMSYISQATIDPCIDHTLVNPFHQDVYEIGMKDSLEITDFFDLNAIPDRVKRCPTYIHLDLSEFEDWTGIGAVAITGAKDILSDDGKTMTSMPFFTHLFSVAIVAPRGDTIPYAKIQRFILWLRKNHFNVAHISRDQYQSSYMAQLLTEQGFTVDKISLDRTPDGYDALKSVLLEQRVAMLDQHELQDELIWLQKDSISGKVDHLPGRKKDTSDGFAGAIWNGTLNTEKPSISTKKAAKVALSAINRINDNNLAPQDRVGKLLGNYKKY